MAELKLSRVLHASDGEFLCSADFRASVRHEVKIKRSFVPLEGGEYWSADFSVSVSHQVKIKRLFVKVGGEVFSFFAEYPRKLQWLGWVYCGEAIKGYSQIIFFWWIHEPQWPSPSPARVFSGLKYFPLLRQRWDCARENMQYSTLQYVSANDFWDRGWGGGGGGVELIDSNKV